MQSVIDRFPKDLTPNNAPVSPYAYTEPLPRSSHTHDYSGCIDWRKGNNDLVYGRHQFSNFFFGREREIVKGENVKQDHRFQSIGLTHTHVFSPTTTGEFRFGFGLFHGRIYQSIFSQVGASTRFNPPRAATLGWSAPEMSVADPTGCFVFKPGPPTAQVSLANVDPGLKMPYTEQWNLTVERQLKWNAALQVSYIGNRGVGLIFHNWRNRAQFLWTSTQPATYSGAVNMPGVRFDKIDPNLSNADPAPGYSSLQQLRTQARRTDGRYGLILEVSNNVRVWGERHQVQFRAEMFNLFNRVMFDMPAYVSLVDTGVAGYRLQPRFLEITAQRNSPRWMQMSLRYTF